MKRLSIFVILFIALSPLSIGASPLSIEAEEGYFEGFDGTALFYRSYSVESARAAIVVVHGFGGHSGMVNDMASKLTENGFGVYAMDLRGHGLSEGERWNVNEFDDYIRDLKIFIEMVKDEGEDIFLLGHSLGGTIVLKYAILYPEDIKGVIASGPGVGTYLNLPVIGRVAMPPVLLRIAAPLMDLLSMIFPSIHIPMQIPPEQLTHDREHHERYVNDPLVCHEPMKLRLSYETLKNMLFLQDNAHNLEVPSLIMYGTEDVIVPPDSIVEFFNKMGASDKEIYGFEGYYHNVFDEVGKERVYDALFSWLMPRIEVYAYS